MLFSFPSIARIKRGFLTLLGLGAAAAAGYQGVACGVSGVVDDHCVASSAAVAVVEKLSEVAEGGSLRVHPVDQDQGANR